MIKHFENFSLLTDDRETPLVLAANYPPVLVPSEIFDDNNRKKYLSLYFDLTELSEVYCDDIADYKAIFSLEKHDLFVVARDFRDFEVSHFLLYLYKILTADCNPEDNVMAVVANETTADFWLQCNGKLMLLNRFEFKTKEDFLYMVLNILVQYNVEFNDCKINIADRASNSEAIELLRQYANQVELLEL